VPPFATVTVTGVLAPKVSVPAPDNVRGTYVGVNAVNIGAGIFGGYGTADDDVPFGKHLRDIYSFLHGFATTEMAFLNGAPV